LVLNGDSYCGVDLPSFWDWYTQHGWSAALVLTRVEEVSRYGQVLAGEDGGVRAFREKGVSRGAGWINAGVYLVQRKRLLEIPTGRPVSLEREIFPVWVREGLGGYCSAAPFIDIGTPESYAAAQEFFAKDGGL